MLTTTEKLRILEDISKTNAQRVQEFLASGETHVAPSVAAPLLGCTPYSLNVSAQQHHLPPEAYYFAGRNCRISLRWLATQV